MSPRITCKVCRRLGFSVCGREKCAFKRKPYAPGVHGRQGFGRRRRNVSEYGAQLKEKQKVKFLYGLRERQFKNIILKAIAAKSSETGRRIIELLETRLDNAVYRLGFASSRNAARQIVGHRHIKVDGRVVNIPSYHVKVGQTISIKPKSLSGGVFKDIDLKLKKHGAPSWLLLDKDKKEALVSKLPAPDEVDVGASLNSVVEFYSR